MVVTATVKRSDGRKMFSIAGGNNFRRNDDIVERTRSVPADNVGWGTDAVLDHVRKALNIQNFTDEEVTACILFPDFVGSVYLSDPSNKNVYMFPMGITYSISGQEKDGKTPISGFVLDKHGLGIIYGKRSIINNLERLNFTRRSIPYLSELSKGSVAAYECFLPRNEKNYIGTILTKDHWNWGEGSIEFHPNKIKNVDDFIANYHLMVDKDFLLNRELEIYYNIFTKKDLEELKHN